MKRSKLALTMLSVMTVASSLTVACSNGKESADTNQESAKTETASQSTQGAVYPIQTKETLTLWAMFPPNLTGVRTKWDDTPFFQEWQKVTGVPMKFIHPAANQEKESLNMMLASGDLPELIEYDWLKEFPGGPEKAISDGYILKLNDLIDKHAPNFKAYLKAHPEVDKQVKTDNGSYYVFPFLRGDANSMVYQGPIIRKDWLDELGLTVPTTIDEWYTVLKAFKEKKGVESPITLLSSPKALAALDYGGFTGAFGVLKDFYVENGKIKYGPMEPGYKEFLATFRKWYAEGLIDKNFATVDTKTLDASMTSGRAGSTIGNTGAGIGKWTPVLKEKDAKAVLAPAPYPVLNKGDKPKFGQKDFAYGSGKSTAITAKTKNPELAVKLLDYGYSEEGSKLFNFGAEGSSYKLDNNYPKYTDLLMKNPDKLSPAQAFSLYTRSNYYGPFVLAKEFNEQYLALPEQREAIQTWQTDMDKYILPPITATPQESSELASIMTDVKTLVDETSLKIILGAEPIEAFDKYVEKLKSLKIDRAIEIEEAALARYNKR
jgi:putative aldouronate transport system substrate-binding protein